MPKFIGQTIPGATVISADTRPESAPGVPVGYLRLSYSQARLLPADAVVCSLDTSDRGGPRSYAKRWYRWYALASDVAACPRSTPKMLAQIGHSRIDCRKHDDCRAEPTLALACARSHRLGSSADAA